MSVLPDWEIEALSTGAQLHLVCPEESHGYEGLTLERPLIEPFRPVCRAPSSYDVLLSRTLLIPSRQEHQAIDLREPVMDQTRPVGCERGFLLYPGRFVLGSSDEWVNIPNFMVCRVEGKSSLARLGIQIHSAGYVDPGYQGNITLEITNLGADPVMLWPDIKIAQLSFEYLHSPAHKPYQGRYQGSKGPVASRFNQEVEADAVA